MIDNSQSDSGDSECVLNMGVRRHGQEGALAPTWKYGKVLCALFSKHVVSFCALRPQTSPGLCRWGTSMVTSHRPTNFAHPWKNSEVAHDG